MSSKIKTVMSVKSIRKLPSTFKWVNSKRSSIISSSMAIILILFNLILTPYVNGLSSIDESEGRKLFGGYRITPKFCRASKTLPKSDPRSEGPTICMFNHECAQRNGEVVGACMDGFLFGACCQVPGVVDTTLIQSAQKQPQSSPNLAAAYETFGSQQVGSNEQISEGPTGSFYDTGSELENESGHLENNYNTNSINHDDKKTNQFYVDNESVLVSSPSSNQFSQNPQRPLVAQITTPDPNIIQLPAGFSTELPMKIPQSQFVSSSAETIIIQNPATFYPNNNNNPQKLNPNDILNNGEFTHSDITHPGAESILIEDDLQFSTGYGPSTVYIPAPEHFQQSTEKLTYQKPAFKPKPATSSTTKKPNGNNGYVLVQTITNGNTKHPSKRPTIEDGMTTNNIESIESIILMLNDTNHGPSYNLYNSTTESAKITFSTSSETRKPEITTNMITGDNYSPNNYYITTNQQIVDSESSTHTPITSLRPTFSNHYISTPIPFTTIEPPLRQSEENIGITKLTTTSRPTISTTQQHFVISSTNHPIIITSTGTKRPTITAFKKPQGQNSNNEIIITPTRKPGTRRPIKNPPSTSYVTGPTPPRLPSTITFSGGSHTLSTQSNDDNVKIDVGVSGGGLSSTSSYSSPQYGGSSTQNINIIENSQQSDTNGEYKPIYIQLLPVSTTQRPHPTVIITPKPTVSNLGSSTVSSWTQRPNINKFTAATTSKQPSTSYIYSPIVTRRPEFSSSTSEYINLPPMSSNDFDDPGYYGVQQQSPNTNRPHLDYNPSSVTDNVYTINGNDDRPVFPGYYGPTPSTFSNYNVPTAAVEKNDEEEEEETYTSPNDFVNFPPVRNPNLNMSATSSSVTTDFDMSTPAFVEDDILKDKMSLLVKKIVSSLQGNFEALADLVEDDNSTRAEISTTTVKPSQQSQTKQTTKITTTRRPTTKKSPKPVSPNRATTPKSVTTKRPTVTTKKPAITKKPAVTRRPNVTTKKPTKLTNKPAKTTKPTKTQKPTRKITTTSSTTLAPEADVVEENIEENEIEEDESAEETRKIQCGVRPHVKSGRIVGGKGAVFGEWPWQVLVRESTWLGLFTKNKCGGVLITNRFVMTAAHCQPGFLASLVAVFGEFDISGDLETKRSVTKNVKRVVVHRQYDAATFENDLALLELESVINYDTHIVPICMPSDIADFTGRMATVTGWGRLKYGGGVPSVLQEVQVPIIENSVCQEMFHTAGHNKKILSSFLCAGYANGQKDSCEGDSGGPLVLQRQDGRWELAGTVSHGIKCAAPYLPGVYMRTTFYKPWLKSVTGIK